MNSIPGPFVPSAPFAFIGVFFIFQAVFIIGTAVGFIFSIIAIWRLSKAHQELAVSVKEIAESLKSTKEL